jgi:hypothetical protein
MRACRNSATASPSPTWIVDSDQREAQTVNSKRPAEQRLLDEA